MECDNISYNNIKNINEIILIMQTKTFISLKEIRILTGCSDRMARILRKQCLASYLFGNATDSLYQTSLKGITTKVRLDKFLEYFDSEVLLNLYHDLWKIGLGETA